MYKQNLYPSRIGLSVIPVGLKKIHRPILFVWLSSHYSQTSHVLTKNFALWLLVWEIRDTTWQCSGTKALNYHEKVTERFKVDHEDTVSFMIYHGIWVLALEIILRIELILHFSLFWTYFSFYFGLKNVLWNVTKEEFSSSLPLCFSVPLPLQSHVSIKVLWKSNQSLFECKFVHIYCIVLTEASIST